MSQSQMLFHLQQIDTQLDRAQARINEIEQSLMGNPELQQAETALSTAQEQLDAEIQSLDHAEKLVHDQSIKISQSEAALYGGKIRIPKELQDLQNEVAALKRYLEKLEDRQLECMLTVETAQLCLHNAEFIYNQAKAAWTEQTAHLRNEVTQAHILTNRLKAERAAAFSPIPTELLTIYENLRKQRNGVAVVQVEGKSCAACGTTLAPAILQSIQSSQILVRCPTCNRILYSG
jgi:predicted  nucleic acid-binding Zn-ribbon protein